jgi:predicted nucleic acid-binding protein
MTFLIDTNVFLEILLSRSKKESCKKFLDENIGDLNITDFSPHSIGVILFRYKKKELFHEFIKDVIPKVNLLSLPVGVYPDLLDANRDQGLDFDDAYQYCVAKYYGLQIATLDRDFERSKDIIIKFIK